MPESEFGKSIRRSLRLLIYATVLIYVATGVSIYLSYRENHNRINSVSAASTNSKHNLCNVENILVNRIKKDIKGSTKFLKEHPNGIDGIPSALILESIRNDRIQVNLLTDKTCPKLPAVAH